MQSREVVSPCEEDGSILRTRVEQGPCFDGASNPPDPKRRETDSHFVPTLADFEKVERSCGKTCVVVLQAGLDDIEKHVR